MRHDRTVNRDTPKRSATSRSVRDRFSDRDANDSFNPTSLCAFGCGMISLRTCSVLCLGSPDAAQRRRPGRDELRRGLRPVLLVLGVGLEHELAHTLLSVGVSNRSQQRKAATITVDDVLARREGNVPASTGAPLPDGEADQLHAVEFAIAEMQLG